MPALIAVDGPLADSEYPLGNEIVVLGRESANDVEVPDLLASRKHCVIECTGIDVTGPRHRIRDLGSANGTLVNGEPITSWELTPGDRIQIGDSVFLYSAAEPKVKHPVNPAGIVLQSTIRLRSGDTRLEVLLEAATTFGSLDSAESVCRALLDAIFAVMPIVERGAVVQSSRPVTGSAWVVGRDRAGEISPPVAISLTAVNQVIADPAPLLSNEISAGVALATSGSLAARQVTCLMAVPLTCGRRLAGVLYLESSAKSAAFTEENLQFAAAMAGLAALAIETTTRLTSLRDENVRLARQTQVVRGLLGSSAQMTTVYRMISKVAPAAATVLVLGESGTGKEMAARAIHAASPRAAKAFLAVNCAVLTEELLASDLFGHEKGAFTGATAQKLGKLELAQGGTLFLDEVAEMSATCQAKLLRFLQEREFERVGGNRVIRADVRIVAATHRDLTASVKQGTFRQDLYFRLNVVSLKMPPLRERKEDIRMLAAHFIGRYAPLCGRELQGLTPEALELLERYDWPGNVRELENAIHRAIVLGAAEWILPEDLPEEVQPAVPLVHSGESYHAAVREARRRVVLDAFAKASGNHQEAARLLEIHPNNLHRLLRELDLRKAVTPPKSSSAECGI